MAAYLERYIAGNVELALSDTPVVFVMGPRQCGKTTLVKNLVSSEWRFVSLDDQSQLAIVSADPIGFIRNLPDEHVVIDEVQRLPEILLAIKQSVDERRDPGRFLLTGSANALVLPQVSDSLAGRVETIQLMPLSECEINQTKPSFLEKILACEAPTAKDIRIRNHLLGRIVTGCFPEPLQRKSHQRSRAWYKNYLNALFQKDLKDIAEIEHPHKMNILASLLGLNSGKLVNYSELGNKVGIDRLTVKKYIHLIEHLFLVNELNAWHSNQYKRIIKTPKIHIADTGIICAMRDIDEEYLINHPNDFGYLVETFVFNELQKQATWIDKTISFYHYRDKEKNEVDIIIETAQGDCFAIEVKASATLGKNDFRGLEHFKKVAGDRFKFGVLLYDGDHTTSFGDKLFAVPLGALWA